MEIIHKIGQKIINKKFNLDFKKKFINKKIIRDFKKMKKVKIKKIFSI
jgi:hypothetical protein